MFGIRSEPVPRKMRLAWAGIAVVVTLALLLSRANRWDYAYSLRTYLVLGYLSALLGYYGCTWRRHPN